MTELRTPPRAIGLAGAIAINLNAAIGAGIFALPALLYAGAGNFAPIVIAGYALVFAFLAATMAKLSTMFDQSGGPQLYADHAFGKFAGFQVGWFMICGNLGGRAANFHVLVSYLAAMFPFFGGTYQRPVTVVSLIALTTMLTIAGTRKTINTMWVGTALKITPIVLLAIIGLITNGLPREVSIPEFSEIESIALLIAYAFSGTGNAIVSAGETKNPTKVIYQSIFINLTVVTTIYLLVQLAYGAVVADQRELDIPLAALGEALFGSTGVIIISLAAIFSIATNQISNFLVMPRALFEMGRRGLLPPIFARVSDRFETPDFAILFYGAVAALLAASGTFAILATMTIAAEQIFLGACIASLIALWIRKEGKIAASMGPHWIVIIGIASMLTLWLTLQIPLEAALSTALLAGLGTGLYFLARQREI